jgi:hypothetical protein
MIPSAKLSAEARAFLDEVRDAEDPTRDDEERVKAALDASIAAGVTCHWERHAAGDAAGAAEKAQVAGAKAGASAWGTPLNVLALCAAAALATGDRHPATPRPAAPSAAHARARLEPSTPPATPLAVPPATPPGVAASPPTLTPAPPIAEVTSRRPRAPAPKRAPSGLAAELELLQRVRAALQRGDGAHALRELDASRETAGSQLLAERRVARVLALCTLGRVGEAEELAADLLRAEPDSVQRAAIERSCANPSRNERR